MLKSQNLTIYNFSEIECLKLLSSIGHQLRNVREQQRNQKLLSVISTSLPDSSYITSPYTPLQSLHPKNYWTKTVTSHNFPRPCLSLVITLGHRLTRTAFRFASVDSARCSLHINDLYVNSHLFYVSNLFQHFICVKTQQILNEIHIWSDTKLLIFLFVFKHTSNITVDK